MAIYSALPLISDVHTHIEPRTVPVASAEVRSDVDILVRSRIIQVVEGVLGLDNCHKLHIRPSPNGYDVVIHCLADSGLPVSEAHRLADEAEKRLHNEVPELGQVLIHVEPDRSE
jgi:divalent metal cation (Fe/Co/Zn/Cd) transporter